MPRLFVLARLGRRRVTGLQPHRSDGENPPHSSVTLLSCGLVPASVTQYQIEVPGEEVESISLYSHRTASE